MCLTCGDGGRSKSQPRRGGSLRGVGSDYLTCGCPVEAGLLELWVSKVAAQEPTIPNRGAVGSGGLAKGDFAFNPITLRIIGAAITEASGLTTQTMFAPKVARLKTTINWAVSELNELHTFDGTGKDKERNRKVITAFLDIIKGIDEA
jgi:hypothetical protein